jgi:hypothetical protein
MTANIPRYIIQSHGPDLDAIKLAFKSAFQICTMESISEITLLVPAKGSFPNTVVGRFLGENVSKALCKGMKVKITDSVYLTLESPKTFNPYGSCGMLIGVHLSRKDQDLMDSVISAKAIVLLPWTEEEGKAWMSTWSPSVIGVSFWQVHQPVLDPAVQEELLRLTRNINLSTGITHPSDKKFAQHALSKLKAMGHHPDPEAIRKWALRQNWEPKDAEDLKKLASRYFKK